MIKFVVALFIFAVALCAYIINAPADRPNAAFPQSPIAQSETEVSRGQAAALSNLPTSDDLRASIAEPAAVVTPDIAVTETIQRLQRETAPEAVIAAGLNATVDNVLISLGLKQPPLVDTDPLDDETSNVLASIGAVTGDALPQRRAIVALSAMDVILVAGLKSHLADADIDDAINTAFLAAEIDAPAGSLTTLGRIDTNAFLSAVVTGAALATGGTAPATPDLWSNPQVITSGDTSTYIVVEGDSLAGIALKLYGDIAMAGQLYAANAAAISADAPLTVTQQLELPLR